MKLHAAVAGTVAAWQTMTIAGPGASSAPANRIAQPAAAISTPHPMAVQLSTPGAAPPALQRDEAGGFASPPPAAGGEGFRAELRMPFQTPPGAAAMPRPDASTQRPVLPPTRQARSTTTNPRRIAAAGDAPGRSSPSPSPVRDDRRSGMADEARFTENTPRVGEPGAMPNAEDTGVRPGIRISGAKLVVSERFDRGYGMFSRIWGRGASVGPGYIQMDRTADDTDSGAMLPPTGRQAGWGYGLYTFDFEAGGKAPGPYILLWPGTDVWPGPEMNVWERMDGKAYSTLHWKGSGNTNEYQTMDHDGIDANERATWQCLWMPGSLTIYRNGLRMGGFTENVPRDAAHGGENAVPSLGMQTSWSKEKQGGENWGRLYGFSYESID